ncbi:hypothetical protein TPB0596_39340 [Tsukamurella pulmonis]|uniref:hypothetical protein n=1 Tax=Tsukamurella pulmonis TaxID=47312 RepID=UPI0007998CC5|nr:hypothetical protein [Tsukamurella pulmonis]KXP11342.1 hypothetical protein AXK57_08355 [Tsukamurella pulmonis]RDH09342.1 hypothetical protein DVB88_23595 [Tsukamurella pulmonis]BDD84171.1 hypothetical protein TPB0596_39340 [Tsukamurella pulmonis]
MKKIVFGAVCAAVLVPFAAPAQAAPDGAGGPAGPTVTYSYVGPATAPQYHQEYVIEVRDGVATAKVGGYGTVDGTAKPAKTQTERLDYPAQRALVQTAPSIPASATGTPCPGAATYRLTYRNPGSEPKRTVAYTCASGDRGDFAALARYIDPVAKQLDVLPRLTFTVTG